MKQRMETIDSVCEVGLDRRLPSSRSVNRNLVQRPHFAFEISKPKMSARYRALNGPDFNQERKCDRLT